MCCIDESGASYTKANIFTFLSAVKMAILQRLFVFIIAHIVASMHAFEIEDCPVECHCQMDGLSMFVDCSGAGLTEFPEFPDNQVSAYSLNL